MHEINIPPEDENQNDNTQFWANFWLKSLKKTEGKSKDAFAYSLWENVDKEAKEKHQTFAYLLFGVAILLVIAYLFSPNPFFAITSSILIVIAFICIAIAWDLRAVAYIIIHLFEIGIKGFSKWRNTDDS